MIYDLIKNNIGGINVLLREFELIIEYQNDERVISDLMLKNNLVYSEASVLYYNLNWKEKCRKFSLETRCITSMFARLFSGFKTQNEWKILVQCCEKVFDDRVLSYGGVISTQVKLNYTNFCQLSEKDKKTCALELLMNGIQKIASIKKWNLKPFISVKEQIISLNYNNTWTWKSIRKNSMEVKVICQHCVDNVAIFLIINDINGNTILDEKVITELPDEWAYSKYLVDIKIEKNKISLVDKKKKIYKSFVV